MGGVYTRRSAGYSVVAMDVPSLHHGRFVVFYRPSPRYAVEAIQKFGPKAVVFHLETGGHQWYIIVCYLASDNTSTIESVVAVLKERPRGAELLVVGDLDTNME